MNNNPSYLRCVETLKANRQQIENLPNFNFVDIGYKIVDGKITNEYSIRIFIHGRKLYEEISYLKFLPKQLIEVSTDIIPTYQFHSVCDVDPPQNRIRTMSPLVGGISIGPHNDIGTLGIVMFSRIYGRCAIGNFHGLHLGEDLFQPSPQENRNGPSHIIGNISHHQDDRDISLMKLNDNLDLTGDILELGTPRSVLGWDDIVKIQESKTVIYKSGRSTGITQGIVTGTSEPDTDSAFTVQPLNNTQVLSCKGDSGCIYMTQEGDILGIHKQGDGNANYARATALFEMVDIWQLEFLKDTENLA